MTPQDPTPPADDDAKASGPPPPPASESSTTGLPSYGSYAGPGNESGNYPPPGGYPPAPAASVDGPFSPGAAIGYGWRKFNANVGPFLLATLLYLIVTVAFEVVTLLVRGRGNGDFSGPALVSDLISVVGAAVGLIFSAVVVRGALDVTEGRPFEVGSAFSRIPVVPIMLTGVIIGVGQAIGIALLVLPGIIWVFLTYFAVNFVVDKNLGAWDAVVASIKLISSNLGNALVVAILAALVCLLGVLLCGVGLLVAYPVATIASTYAYKRFLPEPVAA